MAQDKRTIFIGSPANQYRQLKAISGTPYTIVADDANSCLIHTHGSATVLNLATQALVDIPVGSFIDIVQYGAGQITVTANGTTIRKAQATAKTLAQYATVRVKKIAADEWVLSGELAAS